MKLSLVTGDDERDQKEQHLRSTPVIIFYRNSLQARLL